LGVDDPFNIGTPLFQNLYFPPAQVPFFEQILPFKKGTDYGRLKAPVFDGRVMTRQQNGGRFPALEQRRPGVVRVFQQIVGK
jgi:hypothetical protein